MSKQFALKHLFLYNNNYLVTVMLSSMTHLNEKKEITRCFLFEFFQHELSNSVFGNTMHENLERCKRNLTSYSSPKTTENPPPLLISQE